MKNCNNCQYGGYDPCSDICDGCTHDSETGWAGFTDHSVGRYFNNEEEQSEYYRNYSDNEYDDENESII